MSEIVASKWATDWSSIGVHSWQQQPIIRANINQRISGSSDVWTIDWWKKVYFSEPVDLCLSLGCGHGSKERDALAAGLARHIRALDISPGAIEAARASAAKSGVGAKIGYEVADLNALALPCRTYDAIFAISSIHHVENLEGLFGQCRMALKPGGLLFLDEYIGPKRFQQPEHVARLINELRVSLPAKYRLNCFTGDGATIDGYRNVDPNWLATNDPSEAVRSDEILTALDMDFDVIDYRPYGGAIQHLLYSGIAGNFNPNEESDVAILKMVAAFEMSMEAAGLIGSDFAVVVASPKV